VYHPAENESQLLLPVYENTKGEWNTPSSAKAFLILSMLVDRRRKRFDGCAAWTCIILSRLNDLVLEVRLPPWLYPEGERPALVCE
jgi:hypothetical protein